MRRFSDFYKKVNEQEELATVNFNDPKDLEIDPVSSMDPTIKTLSGGEGGSLDANFQKLLEFQMQIRVFHWGTEVYSEHQAAGLTYDSIDAIMDTLVEAYQGYVGRIKFKGQYTLISYAEVDAFSWMSNIEDIIKQFRNSIEYTDVQNILDELQGAISKFKYLLTLKK